MPQAELRLVVAIVSIDGILLLTWSGAFLFAFAQKIQSDKGMADR